MLFLLRTYTAAASAGHCQEHRQLAYQKRNHRLSAMLTNVPLYYFMSETVRIIRCEI